MDDLLARAAMGDKGIGFSTAEYENRGWRLYLTSLIMILLAGVCVIARCCSRWWFSSFGWDDAVIIMSLFFSIVVSVAIQLAITHGYGMHKSELSTEDLRMALKLFFIAQTPYKVSVCLTKVATILLYLRIFISRTFRVSAFIAMAIIVAWSIGGVFATIFQCVPVAGSWDKSIESTCIDKGKFWVAYAVMNILTDVMVLALPIPVILKLQLKTREKVLLCVMFLLGGFVTVTSILRTTSVQNSLKNKADITWNFIDRGIWTLIEVNLGIISSCLLVLKRPLGMLFPRLFGSVKKISTYKRNKYNRDNDRGYKMNSFSVSQDDSGLWRGSQLAQQSVSISGPRSQARHSDEQHIFGGNDSESETKTSAGMSGISKRIDVSRTSFYQDRPPPDGAVYDFKALHG